MAHPYASKRADKVGLERARKFVGSGDPDVTQDRALIRESVKKAALKRADGGRVGRKSSVDININLGSGGTSPPPPPIPMLPPEGLKPPAPPPMPPPSPPGLPMRARGGGVGPGWATSEKWKTPVQHSPGKNDGKDLGRGRPITYAQGGARGGLARLAKARGR